MIAADDRAVNYGDGLFESMRWSAGAAPLWDWHIERLQLGCERLRLPLANAPELQLRCREAVGDNQQAVLKLIWTAGSGPRGYARPEILTPRALVQVHPQAFDRAPDLSLRWCDLRLALQPRLAGIKHLNRLEQVLARSEWSCTEFDEGLMLDSLDRVVCATAANVFIRVDGHWQTPPLADCGVAGVARRWMLARGARVRELRVGDVEAAEQCVLTNALRGPRAVSRLAARRFEPDADVRALQAEWEQLFARAHDVRT